MEHPEKLYMGYPQSILYDGFNCAVIDGRERSDWFEIKTGVKQGCNMSGFLFLVALDLVMRKTVQDGERDFRWNFTSKLD